MKRNKTKTNAYTETHAQSGINAPLPELETRIQGIDTPIVFQQIAHDLYFGFR